jgi:hypothetical protein
MCLNVRFAFLVYSLLEIIKIVQLQKTVVMT